MPLPQEKLKTFLIKAFPDAEIEIQDLAGDNDHFAVTITTAAFEGKTRIQQHKMVFDALEGHVGTTLHALSVTTRTYRKET